MHNILPPPSPVPVASESQIPIGNTKPKATATHRTNLLPTDNKDGQQYNPKPKPKPKPKL